MRSGLVLAVLSILVFTALAPVRAAVVVGTFDLARGGIGSFVPTPAIELYSPGLTVTTTSELTPAYLATIDVLLIGGQFSDTTTVSPLSASEQSALFNFVSAGGNFGFLGEREGQGGPTGDASRESFLDPFGIDTMGNSSATSATFTNPLHPVADGPFGTITQYGLNGSGWYDNLGPYAVALATEDDTNQPVLLVIESGIISPTSGRVLLGADSSTEVNAPLALANSVAYLVPVPEPSSLVLGALGLVGLVVWKRRKR
jgi:hypothetical protein